MDIQTCEKICIENSVTGMASFFQSEYDLTEPFECLYLANPKIRFTVAGSPEQGRPKMQFCELLSNITTTYSCLAYFQKIWKDEFPYPLCITSRCEI